MIKNGLEHERRNKYIDNNINEIGKEYDDYRKLKYEG